MLFSCYSIVAALFQICLGTVTVAPQAPYQGVYLYQEVGASLPGISSCQNISDVSNVTLRDVRGFDSTTCSYQGREVFLSFLEKEKARPDLNSTNAQYYLLPWSTSLTESTVGWYKSDVEVYCWSGENWEAGKGFIPHDKKKICCTQDKNNLCSDVVFLNETSMLQEQQRKLNVRYGFQMNFTTSLWPNDKLRTRLTCGDLACSFNGNSSEAGICTDLHYDTATVEGESLPSKTQGWLDLKIQVPFLTKDLEGAEECVISLSLEGIQRELVRSVLPLNISMSPPIVSALSDTGLIDVAEYQDSDHSPKCIGDGWPPPESKWVLSSTKKERKKIPSSRREPLNEFLCKCSGEGSEDATKWMMFIKVPDSSHFSRTASKFYDGNNLTCRISYSSSSWDPRPNRLGYTDANGTESSFNSSSEKGDSWEIPVNDTGFYKCWAEIDKTWSDPPQVSTFRLSRKIEIKARGASSPGTVPEPQPEQAREDKKSGEKKEDQSSYYYLIGLGVLGLFLAIFTTFIYKIVKKNQAKVSNLDTKLALDKVKTKMGVNALYSKVDLEDEEPLLARIPRIRKEDLVTDRVLGTGQFGKVLKGRLTIVDEDGVPGEIDVAVKCLMHPEDDSSTEDFLKEVVMMYKLNHPNVIRLLGVCTEFDQYMILSEFMAHGNLRDFLMNREPVLSLVDKLYICYQVVCGLDHMVSQNIVHRDIAARNCLVGPNLVVKVADFGLSRSLAMSNYYKKVGGQVPIRWMSPESLKYGKYTPESDVWAFGVLMWEVYTEGHFPFSGYSNEEVQEMLDNGFKLHVPPHCTEDVSVLMQATWETDPADRPTFRTIRTRLNQMLRNSGMSNILYSSTSPDSLPSTSTQGSEDAHLGDSAVLTDNLLSPPCCKSDTLTRAACFAGEGSSRTTCFLGEESSSGTITNTEVAINRYASEPGVITVETTL